MSGFEMIIGGDVQADTMTLEVYDGSVDTGNLMLIVTRQDPEGTLSIEQFKSSVPVDLVEAAISCAREKLLYPGWDAYKQWELQK